MATLVDIGLPEWTWVGGDWEAQRERDAQYFAEVERVCRERSRTPEDDIVGQTVKWQRADGYAIYAIVSTAPLEIVWVPYGDAWTVEEPLIRGLNLEDVTGMVERERAIREVFG